MRRKLKAVINYLNKFEADSSHELTGTIQENDRIAVFDRMLEKSSKLENYQKVSPRKEYVEASKNRIFDQLMDSQQIKNAKKQPKRHRRNVSRTLVASPVFSIILILVLGFGFVGTVQAADTAAPGDLIYRVDILFENAQILLAVNDLARVHLYLDFASERLLEAQLKLLTGEIAYAKIALSSFEYNMGAVKTIILNAKDGIKAQLFQVLVDHNLYQVGVLEQLLSNATAEAQQSIIDALAVSDHTNIEIAELPQAAAVEIILITHLKFSADDLEYLKAVDGSSPSDTLNSSESPPSSSGDDQYLPPGILDNSNKEDDLPPGLIEKEKPPGLHDKDKTKKK